jgi:hypothetical protein
MKKLFLALVIASLLCGSPQVTAMRNGWWNNPNVRRNLYYSLYTETKLAAIPILRAEQGRRRSIYLRKQDEQKTIDRDNRQWEKTQRTLDKYN